MARCLNCGEIGGGDSSFCRRCGGSLAPDASAWQGGPSEHDELPEQGTPFGRVGWNKRRLSPAERKVLLGVLLSRQYRWRFLGTTGAVMFGLVLALGDVTFLLRSVSNNPHPATGPSPLSWVAPVLAFAAVGASTVLAQPLRKPSLAPGASPGKPTLVAPVAAMLVGAGIGVGALFGLGLGPNSHSGTAGSATPSISLPRLNLAGPGVTSAPVYTLPPSHTRTGPAALAGGLACPPGGPQASNSGPPTVDSAVVEEQSSSLSLNTRSSLYVFGYATGGAVAATDFTTGKLVAATNADGNRVDEVAFTPSPTDSFTTSALAYAIGGVAVSGFSSCSVRYAVNAAVGAPSVTDSFQISTPGSLTVVVALSGGEQSLTLTGLPGERLDATSPPSAQISMEIEHATLDPGRYAVHALTAPLAPGSNPANVGDLLAVVILTPKASY
ncbi:MAG: hypothetical protein M1118_05550 [Chloroflexi bacterium]|nr:hypothetical protein [Chloroflexota bacterium]